MGAGEALAGGGHGDPGGGKNKGMEGVLEVELSMYEAR